MLGKLKQTYSTFEVASGELITVRDLLTYLQKITSSTSKLDFGALPYRKNELMVSNSSNHTLRALGWEPQISIRPGLAQMVNLINSELQ